MSSNTKRNNPYVKKENKKKTEAKNKLKGTIVMVCECGMTPTLSLNQSETNYGKMYLRCGQRHCKLFVWWRFKPNKRSVQILTDGCE